VSGGILEKNVEINRVLRSVVICWLVVWDYFPTLELHTTHHLRQPMTHLVYFCMFVCCNVLLESVKSIGYFCAWNAVFSGRKTVRFLVSQKQDHRAMLVLQSHDSILLVRFV
jgi:hypothetical protein